MQNNKSHQLLSSSIERRLKHLMIQMLTKFENNFADFKDEQNGSLFRSDIKTAVNDVIRATRDELRDYHIEYRPLRLAEDNILSITTTFLETVKKIDFTDKPSIRIYSHQNKAHILDAIRSEFGAGVLYFIEESTVLEVAGLATCINTVIPVMDRYKFANEVRPKYLEWRNKLVQSYIGAR